MKYINLLIKVCIFYVKSLLLKLSKQIVSVVWWMRGKGIFASIAANLMTDTLKYLFKLLLLAVVYIVGFFGLNINWHTEISPQRNNTPRVVSDKSSNSAAQVKENAVVSVKKSDKTHVDDNGAQNIAVGKSVVIDDKKDKIKDNSLESRRQKQIEEIKQVPKEVSNNDLPGIKSEIVEKKETDSIEKQAELSQRKFFRPGFWRSH